MFGPTVPVNKAQFDFSKSTINDLFSSKISTETKKPLMLFFTGSDWCGWCIRLQKEVFLTDDFKKWAVDNVILVDVDFPKDKSKQSVALQNQNNIESKEEPKTCLRRSKKV
mgnify:CR=1 FL=1